MSRWAKNVGSVVVAVVFSLSALPHTARADGDPIEIAKREFEEAKASFERGQYEVALDHFLAAQKIAPAPSLTYNIGLVYERMGRLGEAATAFEKYLTELPAPSTKDERQFRDNLKERARLARERAKSGATQPPPQQPPPQQPPPQQPPPRQNPPVNGQPQQPPPQGYYYPPQPGQQPYYGYQPYAPYGGYAYPPMMFQKTPQQKLEEARGRRGRAIALLAVGSVLTVVGFAVLGYGLSSALDDNANSEAAKVGVDFLGGSFLVVGITLWAPGAASFVKSTRDIAEAQKQLQPTGPVRAPTTFLFNAPTLTF